MKTSQAGIDLIKSFEGLHLDAYRCPAGVLTIGYGHTKGVRPGQSISEAEAERILKEDLERFERGVNEAVHIPIAQNEFDALVSLAFNIGRGAFASSTLVRKLNTGDRSGAADELLRWVRGGGRVLPGLVRRREAEQALFLDSGNPSEPPFTVRDIQQALNESINARLAVDGISGPLTIAKIREFQQRHRLIVDGIVGQQTASALARYLD